MATPLQTKDRQDENFNPGARHASDLVNAERRGSRYADDDADRNTRTVQPGDTHQPAINAAADTARREQEAGAAGGGDDNNHHINVDRTATGDDGKKRKKIWFKGKGPLALVSGGLVTAIFGVTGFFGSLALGPFAFVANVTQDLDDLTKAADIGSSNLSRSKAVSTAEKEAAIRGCTVLSFRCKFATLSDTSVFRLKQAGIEVIADTTHRNLVGLKRTVPAFYMFQGNQFTAEEWYDQLRTNGDAQRAQRKAQNMNFVTKSNNVFFTHVLERFGISKRPPELKGSVQERVNALLNKAGTNSPGELKFTKIEGEGENARYTLDGDIGNPPTTYTQSQVDEMMRSIEKFKATPPLSKVTKASIGAVSALGYWDLACSINNLIGSGILAAQIANKWDLISFGMPNLSIVQGIMAGDINDSATVEAVGNFYAQTDGRQQIPDITSSLESDTLAMVENPNFGKNAYDSSLYQMSAMGGIATPAAQFSLGLGATAMLASLGVIQSVVNEIVNAGDSEACSIIQSWGVRLLGAVATVALTFVTGGGFGVSQLVAMGAMIGVMFLIQQAINNALDGSVTEAANLEENTVGRGDALWTTVAGIQNTNAQAHGLMPSNAEEVVEYHTAYESIEQDYIAIERESAHPLDVKNPYSFMGTFAQSIQSYTSNSSSLLSSLSSIVGIGTLSSLTKNASAANIDSIERFRKCDNERYRELGIDPDVQCNERYTMPREDLQKQPLEVAGWMEENGYVEENTTTGLPKGYTPIDPASEQKGVRAFIAGAVDSFTGQFIDKRAASIEDYNDYAKYLDYCAYRIKPYGDTFEDNHPANGADMDWITGKRCREKSEKIGNFRMYTLYKAVEDGPDEAYKGSGAQPASSSDVVTTPFVSWGSYLADSGDKQ